MKETRGGKRQNSGAKPKGNVQYQRRINPALVQMMDDYLNQLKQINMENQDLITQELLIGNGWIKENLYYQIGGGEEENDRTIYVKDGWALTFDYTSKRWYIAKYDELNYVNGFPYEEVVVYMRKLPHFL